MTKAICFSKQNLAKYSNEDIGFTAHVQGASIKGYYDVVVFDKEHENELSAYNDKLHENIYKIAIIDSEIEANTLECSSCDAWILSSKLENLCKLIESQKIRTLMSKKVNEDKEIFSQIVADNDLNAKSLDLLIQNLKNATSQIKSIFEEQVSEMKHIHSEIKSIREHLDDSATPLVYEDIKVAARKTDDLLGRTDEVIKAMFGFVHILQCEDRLSQIADGIKNVLNVENDMIQKTGTELTDEKLRELQAALTGFFTIEEQRALAMGKECVENLAGCGKIDKNEEISIELF